MRTNLSKFFWISFMPNRKSDSVIYINRKTAEWKRVWQSMG